MQVLKLVIAAVLGLSAAGCATLPDSDRNSGAVPTFANAEEVDAYVAQQDAARRAILERRQTEGGDEIIVVTGSQLADVQITNTQEAGVDEGGIVKATADYLVILRRGRVHVVRHGDETLEKVSSIDAFPPGDANPGDTWYDEMLLHNGMVIVIGYSYGEGGTEISRFNLSEDGQLTYRDTHYLSSSDYYSSSNYASRMVDGTFFTYTPTRFNAEWREDLPFLERRNRDGSRTRVATTLEPSSMGLAAPLLSKVTPGADMMHGITACDVLAEDMTCSTRTVLGDSSSEYYFSRTAAYIWTENGYNARYGADGSKEGYFLYRIPFDTDEDVTAISAQGAPVDQFSFFEDTDDNRIFIMTVGDFAFGDGSFGLQMWESELAFGEAALLNIPLEAMGNGTAELPYSQYREVPETAGRVQNRFIGRHLMYGSGYGRYSDEPPELFIVPLDENWVQRIDIPHGVSRLDRLGDDGVVIGEDGDEALGFSAIEFSDGRPGGRLASTYLLPAAEEGENRSQAFYWRGDAEDPESGDGVMALPVNKEIEGYDFYYLGSSTAMFFLERKNGALSPLGELGTLPDDNVIAAAEEMQALEEAGDCQASCTDWYGNARPIFIGDRIFALMGDEILEGRLTGGQMRELRRLNFAR